MPAIQDHLQRDSGKLRGLLAKNAVDALKKYW